MSIEPRPEDAPPLLPDRLRARPGEWWVVVDWVIEDYLDHEMRSVDLHGCEGFEVEARLIDSSPLGHAYEIRARYVGGVAS